MYCPVCHGYNGDFASRCQNCGRSLTRRDLVDAGSSAARHTRLTSILATTTILSTIVALSLIGLVTERSLWPQLIGGAESEAAPVQASAVGLNQTDLVATGSPGPSRPARPISLDIGQIGQADRWRFVVDGVSFSADDTQNGWSQAVVTYTIQNSSAQAARLDIPSTAAAPSTSARSTSNTPNFLPLPSVSGNALTAADSLRLFLVDSAERRFGGGFGANADSYQIIAAPGDSMRLAYRFRYPATTASPLMLRCSFLPGAVNNEFEINLARTAPAPAILVAPNPAELLSNDNWVTIGDEWAIANDGVDFGPGRGPGERPVVVHLRVKNLTTVPLPALTDRADSTGTLRDFYVSDGEGDIAYSHVDNQPGVIVAPEETRAIMIRLYTQDLPSTAQPLTFSAVLNWQSNLFTRFRIS